MNEVKTSSSQIDLSLQESTEIKTKLMEEYGQYKDICSRSASLYVGINQIYSMSVNVFMALYVKSISIEKVHKNKSNSFVTICGVHSLFHISNIPGVWSASNIWPSGEINLQYVEPSTAKGWTFCVGFAYPEGSPSRNRPGKGDYNQFSDISLN